MKALYTISISFPWMMLWCYYVSWAKLHKPIEILAQFIGCLGILSIVYQISGLVWGC